MAGFTLTEVIVAVAIFTVVILASLMLYDRGNREFKAGVEASNLQQNTRVAFDKLAGDLRMTGYDFDRDGIPVGSVGGSNAYQQPDEQFEYIGPAALTVRANFDYETENAPCSVSVTDNCDNGREKTIESVQFPLVTTANDEIVTYALVPDSQTSIPAGCDTATNCIEFFADTRNPRASFPDAGHGGLDERVVQIRGVDLCNGGCNNPPYTLYRFTLNRAQSDFTTGDNIIRTPLASNIRSLNFTYYQDAQGLDPLKDVDNAVNVSTGATIRGLGQWTIANNLNLIPERTVRAKVNSVRVTLTGMNEAADPSYTDPNETVASAVHFRKYMLETLTAPRNIQKRGMREQDTVPPGSPTITSICTGRCGIVFITFQAPVVSQTRGAPDQYKIIYGIHGSGTWLGETPTFTSTQGWVTGLTPNVNYDFAVVALNSYGSNTSVSMAATPLNATKPSPPTITSVSNNLANKVRLTWTRPRTDASGSFSCATPTGMPSFEMYGYKVERTTDLTGATGWTTLINASALQSTADTVTWDDTTAVNCTQYKYRVSAVEYCNTNAAFNAGNDINLGISTPAVFATAGESQSGLAPVAPSDLVVNQASPCPASICAVGLSWPEVVRDTDGNTITVASYHVYRRRVDVSPATAWADVTAASPTFTISGGTVAYTDSGVSILNGEKYEYRVTATQCGHESDPSPVRLFPCTFPAGVVTTPVVTSVGSFDGSGTSASPWVFSSGTAGLHVAIADPTKVASLVANLYNGNAFIAQLPNPGSPYNFSWAMSAGQTYRIDVVLTETGGCVATYTVYAEEAAQGCCLTPVANDSTVISYSSGSNYVDIYLKNVCSNALTLQRLDLTFNDALTPGGTKFDTIVFPAANGGSNTVTYSVPGGSGTSIQVTPPNGAGAANQTATVAADSTTYKVRVTFSKTLNNPTQPLSSITPIYRRSTDLANVSCQIK